MADRIELKDSTAQKHSFLWWLFLFGICGFLLLIVFAGIIVGPDQTRPVSKPPEPIQVLSSTSVSNILPSRWGQEEPLSEGDMAERESDTAWQDRLKTDLRPVPDVSKLPEALQEAGREYNEAMDKQVSDFISLAVNAKSMSYEEAQEEYIRIHQAYNSCNKPFRQMLEAYAAESGNREELDSMYSSKFGKWSDLATRTNLNMAVAHEKWMDAAGACWVLGGNGPTHDSVWWDREVYYWRKGGLRERGMLAFRSAMPQIFKVAKVFNPDLR